jgi:hypothetical protein
MKKFMMKLERNGKNFPPTHSKEMPRKSKHEAFNLAAENPNPKDLLLS